MFRNNFNWLLLPLYCSKCHAKKISTPYKVINVKNQRRTSNQFTAKDSKVTLNSITQALFRSKENSQIFHNNQLNFYSHSLNMIKQTLLWTFCS